MMSHGVLSVLVWCVCGVWWYIECVAHSCISLLIHITIIISSEQSLLIILITHYIIIRFNS